MRDISRVGLGAGLEFQKAHLRKAKMSMFSAGYTRTLMRAVWTGVNTRRPMDSHICGGWWGQSAKQSTKIDPVRCRAARYNLCNQPPRSHSSGSSMHSCAAHYHAQLVGSASLGGSLTVLIEQQYAHVLFDT